MLEEKVCNAEYKMDQLWRKRERYEERIGGVQDIQRVLNVSFDGVIRSVQSKQLYAVEHVSSATAGLTRRELLTNSINKDKENSTGLDGFGSQMHEHLNREIRRCRQAISDMGTEYNALKSQKSSYQAQQKPIQEQIIALYRKHPLWGHRPNWALRMKFDRNW